MSPRSFKTMNNPCIVIMEDWHEERSGFFRAYTAESPDAATVCPLVGYCSPYGPFRTINAAAMDARRRDGSSPIYRAFRSDKPSKLLPV